MTDKCREALDKLIAENIDRSFSMGVKNSNAIQMAKVIVVLKDALMEITEEFYGAERDIANKALQAANSIAGEKRGY